MTGHQRSTVAFTSIFSFVKGLNDLSPGTTGGVDQLVTRHGMVPIRDSFGLDETNDGGFAATLPIYRVIEIGGAPMVLSFDGDRPQNWAAQNRYVAFEGNGSTVAVSATTVCPGHGSPA